MVNLGIPVVRGIDSNFVTSMTNFLDNNLDLGKIILLDEGEPGQVLLLMLMDIF